MGKHRMNDDQFNALNYVAAYTGEKVTKALLWSLTGGLSTPSKMPGHGWGFSARMCQRGSQLRQVKGSTCEHCYAMKGQYIFPVVKECHERRIQAYNRDADLWVAAMICLVSGCYSPTAQAEECFRWLDSGDLQSTAMLGHFCAVAGSCPGVAFWLPTREFGHVRQYLKQGGEIPENMTIRLSSDMVDSLPVQKIDHPRIAYSMVTTNAAALPSIVSNCPATNHSIKGNSCDAVGCRSCFFSVKAIVAYDLH